MQDPSSKVTLIGALIHYVYIIYNIIHNEIDVIIAKSAIIFRILDKSASDWSSVPL